jgi:tRNA threonylcarbamoyladenosine biosynthesis protein TsaE
MPPPTQRYSTTLKKISSLSREIATRIRGGEILALIGPLGSGKTTFTKMLAKHLGIKRRVTSPTFTLLNSYPAPRTKNEKQLILHHLDLYRTSSFEEVEQLGLLEIWGKPNIITVIEWADMIQKQLPKKTIYIYFEHEENTTHH